MSRLTSARDDSGVAAILVTLLVGSLVLFTMLALVIDIGRLWAERRQLQNGAESAAIAAAFDCSFKKAPCGSWSMSATTAGLGTTPVDMAAANALDGAAALENYCGKDAANLLQPCTTPVASGLNCPRLPGNSHWVQVTTQTLTSTGLIKVPALFARAVIPGYTGTTVHACSQAAWGPPGAFDGVIGIAIDKKCWDAWVNNVEAKYGPSTYSNTIASTYEQILRFSGGNSAVGNCVGSSVNSMGFGWLDTDPVKGRCTINQDPTTRPNAFGGWLQGDGGDNLPTIGSPSCKDLINAAYPTGFERSKLAVPVFDCVYKVSGGNGNCPVGLAPASPTSGKVYYHIVGYASWYLSGYFTSNSDNFRFPKSTAQDYTYTHLANTCGSSATCIAGWFARSTLLAKATIGSGDGQSDLGLNVVQLVG